MTPKRKFDHFTAQAMRDQGYSLQNIADWLGVSKTAIQYAVNPERAKRANERSKARQREMGKDLPCRRCGKLIWIRYGKRKQQQTGFCVRCERLERGLRSVREDTLRCTNCGEWKPDAEFSIQTQNKNRRERRCWCKSCDSAASAARRKPNDQVPG